MSICLCGSDKYYLAGSLFRSFPPKDMRFRRDFNFKGCPAVRVRHSCASFGESNHEHRHAWRTKDDEAKARANMTMTHDHGGSSRPTPSRQVDNTTPITSTTAAMAHDQGLVLV